MADRPTRPHNATSLETRLRQLSKELSTALDNTIRSSLRAKGSSGEATLRPVQLTSVLGLDKSLASRVVRSISSDCTLQALHGIPTPQGLAIIMRAAKACGAADDVVDRLGAATESYAAMLTEFTGGRSDLEAVLAGWIPAQRQRAERDARRSVFRGMTTMSGTRTSAVYNAIYLFPSAHADRVDSVIVAVRQDLRRLRDGARLHVASLCANPEGLVAKQVRSTLGGLSITNDAAPLMIEELCSHPVPKLALEHSGQRIFVAVDKSSLDVNEFATLGLGWRTEAHFPRYTSNSRPYLSLTCHTPRPTEAIIVDTFVHEDLEFAGAPIASVVLEPERSGLSARLEPPQANDPGRLQAPQVVDLDGDPSGLASGDVRSVGAIAENTCREADLDLSKFTKSRARIAFPLPTEELTLWWRLGAAT